MNYNSKNSELMPSIRSVGPQTWPSIIEPSRQIFQNASPVLKHLTSGMLELA